MTGYFTSLQVSMVQQIFILWLESVNYQAVFCCSSMGAHTLLVCSENPANYANVIPRLNSLSLATACDNNYTSTTTIKRYHLCYHHLHVLIITLLCLQSMCVCIYLCDQCYSNNTFYHNITCMYIRTYI